MKDNVQICRGFTVRQWKELRDRLPDNAEADWKLAVEIFERRIRERFLNAIQALEKADSRSDVSPKLLHEQVELPVQDGSVVVPGFSVVALACLLIDTLQSFREAAAAPEQVAGPCGYPHGSCIRPAPTTTSQFLKFLKLPAFGNAFTDERVATQFVRGVRNGILHEAETRGWIVWREEPQGRIVQGIDDVYVLNRTEFVRALKAEFERYVTQLRDAGNDDLRRRFLKKMNDVVKEC